jgi:hypothetical protein
METLFSCDIHAPYILPNEYKGQTMKNGGLTKNSPRKWTEEEIEWVFMLKEKGLNVKQISECIDRDITQVSIKIKRLGKKDTSYNEAHKKDKYLHNSLFLNIINPKSVLDMFSGACSYYQDKVEELYTNDANKLFNTYYSENAEKLIHKLYYENNKYDLIDLDPFGSAYDCFDLAIKMAKKGLIITLGEIGHKRFKRLDFVRRYYGIETLENFTTDNLVKHIIKIGERNKKSLIPIYIKDWKNISRVYFKIEQLKITEQWELK